jgi:lipid II:glycine glycyltransferase (peptidoglycan interpeptide bridge formation enzyme)
MNVREATVDDQQRWDDFVQAAASTSFLQSWAWGEMQTSLGVRFWRLIVEDSGAVVATALVLRRDLPFGQSWLYLPRGPIVAEADPAVWNELETYLQKLARQEKSMFVRIDPAWQPDDASTPLLKAAWKKSEREVQPRHTAILDVTASEADLLAAMHAKTRYNIGLASRRGVAIRFSRDAKDLESFFELALEVMRRSEFRYHAHDYYEAMLSVLGEKNMCELAIAEYQGDIVAAHILVHFGNMVTYAHGASSNKHREIMAPYLLQWESIRRAKAAGAAHFDFFGVAPQGAAASHPWAGITRFKAGFNGRHVEYIGAYDMVLQSSAYTLFNVARRLRSAAR